jgi:hydrogenase nickel incorporation protein HypA/HybF
LHELQITQQIVKTAQRHAEINHARKVMRITLAIGALSGVVPEAIGFCFNVCTKGTLLEDAKLSIENIPPIAICKECENKFDLVQNRFLCPYCEGKKWELLSGRELQIKDLEIM